MPEKSLTLHTMLGNYPNTKAIRAVRSAPTWSTSTSSR